MVQCQFLADGPADGGALGCRRAAAQLVQDDQGAGPNVAQDVGHFFHLQGEGR